MVRIMLLADWHTYQVLTKRSTRMCKLLLSSLWNTVGKPQIWWGVSVENRRDGLPRVNGLCEAPVTTQYLSIKPLCERITGRLT